MTPEQALEKAEPPKPPCTHEHRTFLRTREDWFDGDEDDIYRCDDCGEVFAVYVPR
jgi:DNA-directed RNA polymerase subunit M/transcription elongation factor TFIIS